MKIGIAIVDKLTYEMTMCVNVFTLVLKHMILR